MNENTNFKNQISDLLAQTKPDGSSPLKLISVDFRLGNLCNLKCRMCHPKASSKWIQEWNHVSDRPLSEEQTESLTSIDWYKRPEIWDSFRRHCHNIEHLHFAGGEPLLVPEHQKILEICVEEGVAQNIYLTYNTNLTMIPQKIRKLWPQFEKVQLLVSIDAFGELNDYIRHPSKWSIIDQNLRDIDKNHEALNIHRAVVSATVQIYNVFHLDKLFDYLKDFRFVSPLPNLIHLAFPEYYSIQALPSVLKNLAERRIRRIMNSLDEESKKRAPGREAYLLSMIHYMYEEDRQQELERFADITKKIDESRSENLLTLVPELKDLLRYRSPTRATPSQPGIQVEVR